MAGGSVWHPMLAADEIQPGFWLLTSQRGPYAIVRIIRIGPEIGYRAVTYDDKPSARALIGYFRTLRAACQAAHLRFLAGHGPSGFAPNPWPDSRPPPRP